MNYQLTTLITLSVLLLASAVCAQQPDTTWTKTFGGNGTDKGFHVAETDDGGFIIVGATNSFGAGDYDVWLVRLDVNGDSLWSQTFGGANEDWGYCVKQTEDGGFVIAGYTCSFGVGGKDLWLIKTRSSGVEEWNQTFGGAGDDVARSVCQTTDGGFVVAGSWNNSGEAWVIKTDEYGNEEWNYSYGGTGDEEAFWIEQTVDDGYIIAGNTDSFGSGDLDMWLVKTDSSGNQEWDATFGDINRDEAYCVRQTSDHGFIIAGITTLLQGSWPVRAWIVKTDSLGVQEWETIFEETYGYDANCVIETVDGGYLTAGDSGDFWLAKTDKFGETRWVAYYGGPNPDRGRCVIQTHDGGYAVAGFTESYGAGAADFWLIRLEGELYVSLIPAEPQIVIPSIGGSLEFTVSLTNYTYSTTAFDVWIDVTLPSGMTYGPIIVREDLSLEPHSSLSRSLSQFVGPGAPAGTYSLNAYLGIYDTEIWGNDNFTFSKEGGDHGSDQEYFFDWDFKDAFSSPALESEKVLIPQQFTVSVHPNPFNPVTTISYTLAEPEDISIQVYNISGQHIVTLIDGHESSGTRSIMWNGMSQAGNKVSAGIYLLHVVMKGSKGARYSQSKELLFIE